MNIGHGQIHSGNTHHELIAGLMAESDLTDTAVILRLRSIPLNHSTAISRIIGDRNRRRNKGKLRCFLIANGDLETIAVGISVNIFDGVGHHRCSFRESLA